MGIFTSDSTNLDQTRYSQPAIFALEYALSEMWKAKGVKPSVVLGHSVGEFAAAVLAGIMSVKDAMRLIVKRGQLMTEKCAAGVEKAISKLAESEPKVRDSVAIATINGPKM